MVLEHIFPEDWLEKRAWFAFVLGAGYSLVGILIASILFPGDPALVAVAFTSLLLLPELYKMFEMEERKERMEKAVTFKALWRDDIDLVKIYIFLFLGILIVYSFATIILPSFETNTLFREQLEIRLGQGFAGQAVAGVFGTDLFWSLLSNNFMVMLACFFLALLTGDGAIFLITWNASVWGTIFGFTAKSASMISGQHPFLVFATVMVIVFPHMMIEAMSYFLAAISGSVISKDVLLEKLDSDRFMEVFSFNLYLLFAALVFLVLGCLVETFVLENATTYRTIIDQSMLALRRF